MATKALSRKDYNIILLMPFSMRGKLNSTFQFTLGYLMKKQTSHSCPGPDRERKVLASGFWIRYMAEPLQLTSKSHQGGLCALVSWWRNCYQKA
jgi:hypothetical protein